MSQTYTHSAPLAWTEINLKALRHNFRQIKKCAIENSRLKVGRGRVSSAASADVLAVVKADAYGHGMVEVARAIEKEGGRFFAVSNVEEGITLRLSGNKQRILLLETTLPSLAPKIIAYGLTPTVCTLEFARELNRFAGRVGKKVSVHVKVDTGMSRLGVLSYEAMRFIEALAQFKRIHIEGLFTHLPVADTDRGFTEKQIASFKNLARDLAVKGLEIRYLHVANSMGLLGYKGQGFDLVRPGITLYGFSPDQGVRNKISLKPVMSVKARVLLVKKIFRGQGISYGHTVRAKSDMQAAVLAIGYSDGFFRSLSSRAHVLINGKFCPVLGRVTMDQIIVDVTRAGKVSVGDEAVVIGKQGRKEISADDLAQWAGTINYEVVCNLGNRLPRKFSR